MKARNREAEVPYRWCGKCVPPGLLLNFTPVGPTSLSTKEGASQAWAFIPPMRSHDRIHTSGLCWLWACQWWLKTTEVNFQLKDVKYLSQISSASNIRFRHLGYSSHFKSLFATFERHSLTHMQNRCTLDKTATQTKVTPKQRHKHTAATHLWTQKTKQIVMENQK